LLTAEAIFVGILAGYVVGVYLLGIDHAYIYYNMLKHTSALDVAVGLIKAFIFGGIIALTGCHKGLNCGGGAEGVGKATTEAVVYASITILISNFFLTLTLNQLFHIYD
jgi:phospholipid/cholesterol/gamma-HCH transport system permease protein